MVDTPVNTESKINMIVVCGEDNWSHYITSSVDRITGIIHSKLLALTSKRRNSSIDSEDKERKSPSKLLRILNILAAADPW